MLPATTLLQKLVSAETVKPAGQGPAAPDPQQVSRVFIKCPQQCFTCAADGEPSAHSASEPTAAHATHRMTR
jgi:hypothetical protein